MIIATDYDADNTANVLRALQKIGIQAELSNNRDRILAADDLILPGVGVYPVAVAELQQCGLVFATKEAVAKGAPLLDICLGMQVSTEIGSEHRETQELGPIPGVCYEIRATKTMPVSHMGWNDLTVEQDSPLTVGFAGKSVYSVHGYFTDVPKEYIGVTADYGIEALAMIHKDNVYEAQLHPEESGDAGLEILERFIASCDN